VTGQSASKDALEEQSDNERPVQAWPMLAKQAPTGRPETRRLADWINPTGAKKNIHPINSLIDKVYQKENLSIAWERVKENRAVEVWLVS
jgi:hypothetical protein